MTACREILNSYEILIVDDGSSDRTWDVIQGVVCTDKRVRGLRLSRNFGKEVAIVAGLSAATGDAVVVVDADLQHPIDLIPEMVTKWREEQVDIVNAVKADRGKESLHYKFAARLFNALLLRVSGLNLAKASDFKLMDRRVVDALLTLPENQVFFRGLVAWLGFRATEIPMTIRARERGRSRWTLARLVRLAVTGLTAFSTFALHGVTFLGIAFLCAAVILSVNTINQWISGEAIKGFTTVILLQLIIGSVLMIGLGIIGEYLSTIYYEVKRRPRYVIADSCGTDIK